MCLVGTEPESTAVPQSSIPTLAAQSAPSIMRKRGYEHINGVEGELNGSLSTMHTYTYKCHRRPASTAYWLSGSLPVFKIAYDPVLLCFISCNKLL